VGSQAVLLSLKMVLHWQLKGKISAGFWDATFSVKSWNPSYLRDESLDLNTLNTLGELSSGNSGHSCLPP
jgi:hypothetical protein